jgi:hypothetical protein
MTTPERSARAFYDGLVKEHQDPHVRLLDALPALVALIRFERAQQRERCAALVAASHGASRRDLAAIIRMLPD